MIVKTYFRDNFFFWFLLLFIIIVSIFSYYRFIVQCDYVVSYEGKCDPAVESCFIGCEDDECTEEYYYSEVQKYAPDLYKQCGEDITDCALADVCLPTDKECSVIYCNSEIGDNCAVFISSSAEDMFLDTDILLKEDNIE